MLTLMWVVFLGVRFEMEGWGKITPCIKLVTHPYLGSKCMSFSNQPCITRPTLINSNPDKYT